MALGQYAPFRDHAVQRMFQRHVTVEDVRNALDGGEELEAYPKDQPYPSRLVLGWRGSRPLHVLVAQNVADDETIIITVYEPDPFLWDASFRRRRR
jgi:Domain of unknown function (DUF4258)